MGLAGTGRGQGNGVMREVGLGWGSARHQGHGGKQRQASGGDSMEDRGQGEEGVLGGLVGIIHTCSCMSGLGVGWLLEIGELKEGGCT